MEQERDRLLEEAFDLLIRLQDEDLQKIMDYLKGDKQNEH